MKKILIFYAAYGGGHFSAAKSIKKYLDNNYDYTTIIYQAIEQQNKALIRAKDFYLRVNKYVNIRPIRWLELI